MSEDWRGKPNTTKRKELLKILKLVNASANDIFCDLGCGNGNLCKWASKKVKFAIGMEDDKKRYRNALRNIKVSKCKNVKILNENYRDPRVIRKLKDCTIFYCTNDLTLGFYKKLGDAVNHKTYIVSYFLPPYPILPEFHDGWFYFMKTPLRLAKNKSSWIKAVDKMGSSSHLERKIRNDFEDYEDKILELNESISGLGWAAQRNHHG